MSETEGVVIAATTLLGVAITIAGTRIADAIRYLAEAISDEDDEE